MWALLNSLGTMKQFVYGFTWQPTHESLLSLEGLKAMWAGIREVQPTDKVTFISKSFRDDDSRLQDLAAMAALAPEPETRFFILGEQKRLEELTRLRGTQAQAILHLFHIYSRS